MKNLKLLLFVIALIVTISILFCIILANLNLISSNLSDNLIGSILGSGLIAAIVTSGFYVLRENVTQIFETKQAQAFYNNKLIPSLKEVFMRDCPEWNPNGGKKAYYDNSYNNSIFDLYQSLFDAISNSAEHFKEDELYTTFTKHYNKMREAYVLGEKMDNIIMRVVRLKNARVGIQEHMDRFYIAGIKGKLFTDLSKDEVYAMANLEPPEGLFNQMVGSVSGNSNYSKYTKNMEQIKKELEGYEHTIKRLVNG